MKQYALTVKRTTEHQFTVSGRSGAEAAMKLGQQLAADPTVFDEVEATQTDLRLSAPVLLGSDDPQLDLDAAAAKSK